MTIIHARPLKNYGVCGPTSALDNEVLVSDGTTGKKIKASGISTVSGGIFKNADNSTRYVIGTNALHLFAGGKLGLSCSASQVVVNTNEENLNFRVHGHNNDSLFFIETTENRIGINQAAPACCFHITDGAILAEGTTGGTPASGAGTRLMWIPAKAAFRVGIINPPSPFDPKDQWDDVNIGMYSFAAGDRTKASGDYSTAFGKDNIASSEAALCFGRSGSVTSSFGTHFGSGGRVSGISGIHFGSNGEVGGANATHFGLSGKAKGDYSWVGGKYMQLSAAANNSFAWGYHTSAVALTQPNTFYIFPSGTAGKVAIGVTVPTAMVDVGSDIIRLRNSKTPATAGAAGEAGSICFDSDFGYRCVATNTWKRWAIATW